VLAQRTAEVVIAEGACWPRGTKRPPLGTVAPAWLRYSRDPCFAIRNCRCGDLRSARKHGDGDIAHAVITAEQDDGKVLYLGPGPVGNLLEVVAVAREDGTEVVIHAMAMRRIYEPLLREMGGTDD